MSAPQQILSLLALLGLFLNLSQASEITPYPWTQVEGSPRQVVLHAVGLSNNDPDNSVTNNFRIHSDVGEGRILGILCQGENKTKGSTSGKNLIQNGEDLDYVLVKPRGEPANLICDLEIYGREGRGIEGKVAEGVAVNEHIGDTPLYNNKNFFVYNYGFGAWDGFLGSWQYYGKW